MHTRDGRCLERGVERSYCMEFGDGSYRRHPDRARKRAAYWRDCWLLAVRFCQTSVREPCG